MTENSDTGAEKEQKSVWKLLKRVFKWVAIILVVVLVLMIWAGNNIDVIDKKIRTWQAERYDKAMQKIADEKKARYMADKDGGKTPEETLDLFIAALKAGDIEKASKYYVLEKQGETLKDFKDEIAKYGDLHLSVDYFIEVSTKGIKGCNKEGDGCAFEYEYIVKETKTLPVHGRSEVIIIPAGEKSTKLIDVKLNHFSGVWKIELP